MISLPLWQKILIEISKGKNSLNNWKSIYSKQIIKELELEKLIKINGDRISLTESGAKITGGVVVGFFERI